MADVQRLAADPSLDLFHRGEIITLGRRTVTDWLPVIVGHLVHDRDQLHDVLRSRGRLPERFDRPATTDSAVVARREG